jgi:hypothetical protein
VLFQIRMKRLRPDLYAIRGWFVLSHQLVSGRELVLIDTGLFGGASRFAKRRVWMPTCLCRPIISGCRRTCRLD